ncbi:MAG: hypothetical protein COB81_08285 [Flavobacteriaceae bacterium]|nr:MAG: hypothetical protein COB81_08285 [Flavobacteriaceae bacterium]
MGILTILLIITTAWFIYHFVVGYNSKQANLEKFIRRIAYGKSMGIFALLTGICGQMIGLRAMFSSIEGIVEVTPPMIFRAVNVTLICPIFGILIYLFSLVLWFASSLTLEKKLILK